MKTSGKKKKGAVVQPAFSTSPAECEHQPLPPFVSEYFARKFTGSENEAFGGVTAEHLLAAYEKAAEQATNSEERRQSLEGALHLKNLSSRKLIQEWHGLFKLYQQTDGKFIAERAPELEIRLSKLKRGYGPTNQSLSALEDAMGALVAAAFFLPRNIPEWIENPDHSKGHSEASRALKADAELQRLFQDKEKARILCNKLQETLAPRLRDLYDGSKEDQLAKANKLKKDIGKAIDGLLGKSVAHASKGRRENKGGAKKSYTPSPSTYAAVIDEARIFVEQNQQLPTKKGLRKALEDRPPGINFTDKNWTEVLRETGLQLPEKRDW